MLDNEEFVVRTVQQKEVGKHRGKFTAVIVLTQKQMWIQLWKQVDVQMSNDNQLLTHEICYNNKVWAAKILRNLISVTRKCLCYLWMCYKWKYLRFASQLWYQLLDTEQAVLHILNLIYIIETVQELWEGWASPQMN